jgi:hypothetical protein
MEEILIQDGQWNAFTKWQIHFDFEQWGKDLEEERTFQKGEYLLEGERKKKSDST